jgi:SET domain-containing protein
MLLVETEVRPSPVHNVGTFLVKPIKKGTVVWRYDGRIDRIFTEAELQSLPEIVREYIVSYATLYQSSNLWVFSGDNDRFTNHSDKPNCVCKGSSPTDDVIAATDLAAGVELTQDYFKICDSEHEFLKSGT